MVYLVLVCFALFCGGILYFMFWERAWLGYAQKRIPVLSREVAPGQNVSLFVERTNTDKETRNYITTVELRCDTLKKVMPLGAVPVTVEAGASRKIGNNIVIPTSVADDEESPPRPTPSGNCNLEGVAEIQGLIRTIHVPWKTEVFRVVAQ